MSFEEKTEIMMTQQTRNNWMVTLTAAAIFAAASPRLALANSEVPSRQVLQQKAGLVESIIMRSVRGIVGRSGEELDELAEARKLLDEGRRSLAAGQDADASEKLDAALKRAVAFSNKHRQQNNGAAIYKARYDQRKEGVTAFRKTYSEILQEKGQGAATVDLGQVDRMSHDAENLAGRGQYRDADITMRRAYDMLAGGLARIRANETLEHRLVFASPMDEYRYEAERYRSHQMLLTMVVRDRNPAPEVMADVEGFRSAAGALASQAGAHAGRGNYQRAIEAQESATEQLIKALREAGMFLPY